MNSQKKAQPTANDRREPRVFLSYSRKDTETVDRLDMALKAAEYNVLIDRSDIAAGDDWKKRLGDLIQASDTVLFIVSRASTTSEICGWEVEESIRLGKKVLPVLIEPVAVQDRSSRLFSIHFLDFTTQTFEAASLALIKALETDLPWVREHTRLGDLAGQWNSKGRSANEMLRGSSLVTAEAWIASQPLNSALPTVLQRSFIAASRQASTTRQRRWIGGAVVAVVAMAGLLVQSERWRAEAEVQRAEAVAQRQEAEKQRAEAVTQRQEADRQRSDAERLAAEERRQKDRAEANLQTATNAVGEVVVGLLQPLKNEKEISPETLEALHEAAERGVLMLKDMNRMTDGLALTLAGLYSNQGDVLAGRDEFYKAKDRYERSVEMYEATRRTYGDAVTDLVVISRLNKFRNMACVDARALHSADCRAALARQLEATQRHYKAADKKSTADIVVLAQSYYSYANSVRLLSEFSDCYKQYAPAIELIRKFLSLDNEEQRPFADYPWETNLGLALSYRGLIEMSELKIKNPKNVSLDEGISILERRIGKLDSDQIAFLGEIKAFRAKGGR